MNISTGGTHILLFERDQQLATLLISELQLAGYESHTARTAVEVFDAIARYPVRLVLVNLSQAAAARREFWVALDTQRRGRGVQVLTFRCTNLAGYGPADPDERSTGTVADMEIDGMLGLMNLVDAVRARLPGAEAMISTTQRQPRVAAAPMPQMPLQRPVQVPTGQTNPRLPVSGTTFQAAPPPDTMAAQTASRSATFSQAPANMSAAPVQQAIPTITPPAAGTPNTTQPSYTEKIRAVLYPNQRTWSSSGNTGSITPLSDNRAAYDTQNTALPTTPISSPTASFSTLQRLANGQLSPEGQKESGLAQLSRMVQERQNPVIEQASKAPYYSTADTAPRADAQAALPNAVPEQIQNNTYPVNYAQAAPRVSAGSETIGTQPLRASPFQDLPVERSPNGQTGAEVARRPDVLSRTNYGQQPVAATPIPPLSSLATPLPEQVATVPSPPMQAVPPAEVPPPVQASPAYKGEQGNITEELQGPVKIESVEESISNGAGNVHYSTIEQARAEIQKVLNTATEVDEPTAPDNAMLLDIVQSLPPMPSPPPQPQAMQPQVLSGRATRTLGSVLLAGHLVPENRLEVAQNIQRMLRGVDLNYQLGEILLMFKLLTPDQLLAASLVSYGLITTTQISALGRIRQELHAIGLEYDLENLLILFRILTPEQLREVRSSWQS
ncbi:MAG: hypothetical protein JOZ18_20445 [Chloroflexi bacterium]|nr:hypothetical protein [Chloroflexota bacterium]